MAEIKWNNVSGSDMNTAANQVQTAYLAQIALADKLAKSGTDFLDVLATRKKEAEQYAKEMNTQFAINRMNQADNLAEYESLAQHGLGTMDYANIFGSNIDLAKYNEAQANWQANTLARQQSNESLKDLTPEYLDQVKKIQLAAASGDPEAMKEQLNNISFGSSASQLNLANEVTKSILAKNQEIETKYKAVNDAYKAQAQTDQVILDTQDKLINSATIGAKVQELNLNLNDINHIKSLMPYASNTSDRTLLESLLQLKQSRDSIVNPSIADLERLIGTEKTKKYLERIGKGNILPNTGNSNDLKQPANTEQISDNKTKGEANNTQAQLKNPDKGVEPPKDFTTQEQVEKVIHSKGTYRVKDAKEINPQDLMNVSKFLALPNEEFFSPVNAENWNKAEKTLQAFIRTINPEIVKKYGLDKLTLAGIKRATSDGSTKGKAISDLINAHVVAHDSRYSNDDFNTLTNQTKAVKLVINKGADDRGGSIDLPEITAETASRTIKKYNKEYYPKVIRLFKEAASMNKYEEGFFTELHNYLEQAEKLDIPVTLVGNVIQGAINEHGTGDMSNFSSVIENRLKPIITQYKDDKDHKQFKERMIQAKQYKDSLNSSSVQGEKLFSMLVGASGGTTEDAFSYINTGKPSRLNDPALNQIHTKLMTAYNKGVPKHEVDTTDPLNVNVRLSEYDMSALMKELKTTYIKDGKVNIDGLLELRNFLEEQGSPYLKTFLVAIEKLIKDNDTK